jgi:hypothetical protein
VLTDKNIYSFPGSPREIVQGGTRLLWGLFLVFIILLVLVFSTIFSLFRKIIMQNSL